MGETGDNASRDQIFLSPSLERENSYASFTAACKSSHYLAGAHLHFKHTQLRPRIIYFNRNLKDKPMQSSPQQPSRGVLLVEQFLFTAPSRIWAGTSAGLTFHLAYPGQGSPGDLSSTWQRGHGHGFALGPAGYTLPMTRWHHQQRGLQAGCLLGFWRLVSSFHMPKKADVHHSHVAKILYWLGKIRQYRCHYYYR